MSPGSDQLSFSMATPGRAEREATGASHDGEHRDYGRIRRVAEGKPVSGSKTIMARTMLPSDANPYGNVHGGEVMKLIDACAGAAATRHARSRVVTAFVDELSFLAPVYVGDLVTAKASVNHVGRSSMEVGVRVEAENLLTGKVVHVSSAHLVFVGIDEAGNPVALPPLVAETDEEKRHMRAAEARRKRRVARKRVSDEREEPKQRK